MYSWSIQTRVQECEGILINQKHIYSILVRLDNNFSQQSKPASIIRNKLQFKTTISLQFQSDQPELSSNNLQILLIKNQASSSNANLKNSDGHLNKGQEIIGIATIKIKYPLPEEFYKLNTYNFDRSFQKRSTIKISLSLKRQKIEIQHESTQNAELGQGKEEPWLSLLKLQIQKNMQYQKHLSNIFQQINHPTHPYPYPNINSNNKVTAKSNQHRKQLQKQRDELYKLSQNLYKQLKDCSNQRDEFLRDLRQKQLAYDQLKQQFQFIKFKLDQYENNVQHNQILLSQLEYYKNQSQATKICLEQKQKQALQMQRKIKESLMAMQNFKNQAIQARNQLINRQFEHSTSLSRCSKYIDPVQIIEQLSYEIRTRKIEEMYILEPLKCNKMQFDKFYKLIQKQIIILFTQLINKMPAQKNILIKKKSQFLHKIEELTFQQSIVQD